MVFGLKLHKDHGLSFYTPTYCSLPPPPHTQPFIITSTYTPNPSPLYPNPCVYCQNKAYPTFTSLFSLFLYYLLLTLLLLLGALDA